MRSITKIILNWFLIMFICILGLIQAGLLMYGHELVSNQTKQAFSSILYNDFEKLNELTRSYVYRDDILPNVTEKFNSHWVKEYFGPENLMHLKLDSVMIISPNGKIIYSFWADNNPIRTDVTRMEGLQEIIERTNEVSKSTAVVFGMGAISQKVYMISASAINHEIKNNQEVNLLVFVKKLNDAKLQKIGSMANLFSIVVYNHNNHKNTDLISTFFEKQIPILTVNQVQIGTFGIIPKIIWPFYLAFLVTPIFLLMIFIWGLSLLNSPK